MKRLFKFLGEMLSSASDTSSKRFNGTYGFAAVCFSIVFISVKDVLADAVLSDPSKSLLLALLYVSATLLGLGAIVEGVKHTLTK